MMLQPGRWRLIIGRNDHIREGQVTTTNICRISSCPSPGGMTGLELGRAIRARYHGMPVLLATGYSDSARDAVEQGFVVLQKPFDLAALEQGLRDAQKRTREPADPERAAS